MNWKFVVGQEVTVDCEFSPSRRVTVTKQGAGYKKNKKGEEIVDYLSYFLVDKNEKLVYFRETQLKG